ncbi:glucose sensor NDAI_0A02890 [Naumovozyma dairenensis CBS 421]|uniref:Major facilitator superfamily (MFS) profile domain-containing protein n=1 Tax=Naumovozyma dairenensis (strain ATCC 10597 / BCRC 20456 / CBS 421 / NBRC 0211 / NRRL Y-12639) TaxID=1071378 RepID=G0W3Q8_NAUDC|nr:hypothetical protein NDAI_0A02890 [Naumovozyma dairenensis CBS 421]CCD22446.1 hypothetical protein NDAI_0A02890 [Naumovozyma dairenensis CBS 421]
MEVDSDNTNRQAVIDRERRGFLNKAIKRVTKSLLSGQQKSPSEGSETTTAYSTPITFNENRQQPILNGLSHINDLPLSRISEGNENSDSLSDDESFLFSTPPQKQRKIASILVGVFVAVGGFLFGYDTGLINSITEMNYVKTHLTPNHEYFTSTEMSILVSFLSLGTFIGALSAPIISDSYGRKLTIMMSTIIIFSIGNSLQVGASGMVLLVVGRVISGLGIGLISAVVPLYQAEAAHKSLRGAIISTYQWAITWGLLVSSAVAQGTHNRTDATSYRLPLGLQYVWSFILAIGMIFLPESPRYYVLKDELDKAAEALSFLRRVPIHDSGLLEELVEIKATYDYESSFGSTTFWDCFLTTKTRPKQTLRMFTGIAIQAFQQFSGINFIFYYGVNFFNDTGVHNSYLVSFICYAVNVIFNVPGMILVEFFGRRKVLLTGGVLMFMSNFIIAIVGSSVESVVADKVMIAFICLFIAAFSATWGGVVWVISAELYPLGIRSKCTAICAAANWLVNFICALITPYIVDTGSHTSTLGPKIYFIWGSLNALATVVVYFTVYETKGLTLEQIDELYSKSSNSLQSTRWNKRIKEESISLIDERKQRIVQAKYEAANVATNDNKTSQANTIVDESGIVNPLKNMPHPSLVPTPLGSEFQVATQDHHDTIPNINASPITETDPDIRDLENNYVDLGNGLALNTYTRGPPSLSTDSDGTETEITGEGTTSQQWSEDRQHMDQLNDYMAQLIQSDSSATGNSLGQNTIGTNLVGRTVRTNSDLDNFNMDRGFLRPVTTQSQSRSMPDNYLDLGNGLGLNTYNRGPPSILMDSSEEELDLGEDHSTANYLEIIGRHDNDISAYVAPLTQNNTDNIQTSPNSTLKPTFEDTPQENGTTNLDNNYALVRKTQTSSEQQHRST